MFPSSRRTLLRSEYYDCSIEYVCIEISMSYNKTMSGFKFSEHTETCKIETYVTIAKRITVLPGQAIVISTYTYVYCILKDMSNLSYQ